MSNIPFEKQVHLGETTHIIAPEELFTCPLPNNSKHEIDKAKLLITQIAGEMGFSRLKGDWQLQRYRDENTDSYKWRLDAKFTGLNH